MTTYEGKHIGFYADFVTRKDEQILMKSGISFTSLKNAEENLYAEIKGWDFDETHETCVRLWDKELSKITVTGGTEDEKKDLLYSNVSHTDRSSHLQ